MKDPRVTVLMSVYNGGRYLREAIDSILNQTFKDFEFLIVNDGSTDGTAEILQRYNDHRIKVIENRKNIGFTKSLNKGLRVAKGEFIARMDADDVSEPERLEKELKFLHKHPDYAVVGTFIKVLDEAGNVVGTIEKPVSNEQIKEFLKKDNCIAHGSAMARKSHILGIGAYDEAMEAAQDFELWLRLSKGHKMANMPEYLYMWRQHKGNISSKHGNEQKHFVEVAKVRANLRRETKQDLKKPKFSVLMANYNNDKYAGEAIQSVLNQTFKDWELVIVDDCSTDNSVEVIKPYLKDERIRLLKNKTNRGYISSLKRLVYESRAEILGTLDSDDVLAKNALEKMYHAHKNNQECGFIYSQYVLCDVNLNPIRVGRCKAMPPNETNLRRYYAGPFRTFKKKDYFKTGGFDEEILYAEDKDLILAMEEISNLLFVDKILYKQRLLPHSQSYDPIKNRVGTVSHVLAKYKAYKRRLNTNTQNLTQKEMVACFFYAAALCLKKGDFGRMVSILSKAVELVSLNFKRLKTFKISCFFL